MTAPAFVADVMVGKLARWLRVLGCDVVYSNDLDDDAIVRIAEAENRIILTRDNGLIARKSVPRYIFIENDHYREQVRQVVKTCGLTEFKEAVFEKIPPFVYLTQDRFAACPDCGRVYWHGTHADQMLKRLPIRI